MESLIKVSDLVPFLSVDFLESAILQKKIDIQQQRRFKQCVCGKFLPNHRSLISALTLR